MHKVNWLSLLIWNICFICHVTFEVLFITRIFNCENFYWIALVFISVSVKQSSLLNQIDESALNMHEIICKAWNSQSCNELTNRTWKISELKVLLRILSIDLGIVFVAVSKLLRHSKKTTSGGYLESQSNWLLSMQLILSTTSFLHIDSIT
jgi:hypothetical protein